MANELQYRNEGLTGSTLYAVLFNSVGQAWNGSAFATYTTTRTTWDIAATEISGTGLWQATMPSTGAAKYSWAWYVQAGGSPSHTDDTEVGRGDDYWDGTAFGVATIQTNVASLTAGSISIAPNLVPVPAARTWTLVQGSTGLVGDRTIGMRAGETKTFAIDFARDLSANGLLTAFSSIAITTGTSNGVTFDTSDDGVNRTRAVIQITGVTAGTYTLTAIVTVDDSDGGGISKGVVTLNVT